MAILNNSNAISSGGYDINNSLRFRSSASAYLNRTPGSAGNRTTWTWSSWVKLGSLSSTKVLFSACTASNSTGLVGLQFTSSDTLQFFLDTGATSYGLITTQVFRDPSAWYHIVVALDTTQATSTNRIKLYINGSQVTAFGTATYPAQNDAYAINNTQAHNIGRYAFDGTRYFDGYVTEINLIDGQALTPSSFGETDTTTGSWKPKAYTSTYGTNGFYLKLSDIATTSGSNAGLGKDFSGNANYWTTNNISVTSGTTYDAMTDVPTLTSATAGNYCVINPLNKNASLGVPTNANLTQVMNVNNSTIFCSMGVSSGKWYWEVNCTSITSLAFGLGVASDAQTLTTAIACSDAGSYGYYTNGQKINNNTFTTYGASYATGDVIGIALDMDSGTITFYKNNTSQGTAFTGLSGTKYPALGGFSASSSTVSMNFGQRPFTYTPPTGYVALNTFNLPDSTIKKGNTVMDATTYTGNGSTNVITNNSQFKPDFVWVKGRSIAYVHGLFDSVRGVGKNLNSANTNAENSNDTDGYLSSFNNNGFTLIAGSTSSGTWNTNAATYVGWQWQAGQGSSSSNTSGSITSTVSVNATAGFSIITYAGVDSPSTNTIGHGLGVAPKFWIIKNRSGGTGAYNWVVNYNFTGTVNYLFLNSTQTENAQGSPWSTLPTSSVITLGANDTNTCNAGDNYVCYAWAEIAGFSKFGSYTGNGSTDGPFMYLGFRPKFVMFKRTDGAAPWVLFDSSRNTFNVVNSYLLPNASDAEANGTSPNDVFDFLSNGLKIRCSNAGINQSGATYIYMAFAENPFKNANAR